ncbi:MAG: GHKL domain-containing protein [Bacteroidaceae bacterium]|nr:GHKL domain-containing protein [Bacteroidaceae bacterium]
MKRLTEGRKMFIIVMAIYIFYGAFFVIFDDFDRRVWTPLSEEWDWHMMGVGIVILVILAFILHRYSHRMDERISREQAEKENTLRRQLTQNIGHELKTPVASILGYTETLKDNPDIAPDIRQQFIERTHSQAERLTHLLSDLSTLNRLDNAPDKVEKERLDLCRLFSDIVQEVQLSLTQHNMTLRNCLPGSIVIRGNQSLLYSVFRNLIDNAINHAGNGTTIELTASELPRHWQFTFSDNGVGIADKHLPHIFERFYRIDKSRSRATGGTGLGLSIVKNAIVMHGGNISVKANQPRGLIFTFTLEK